MGSEVTMRKLILLLLMPTYVMAECILVERNSSSAQGTLDETRNIQAQVIQLRDNSRQCSVSFEGRINGKWHTGYGYYKWQSDMPDDVACANAFETAKANLVKTVGEQFISTETMLKCDENNSPALQVLKPGQVLEYGQWRPHPKNTNTFWYEGALCNWFVETNLAGNDMRQWEGIVCQTTDNKWVVVDKF